MTMLGQEKPSLEDLTHYGTKGMKWGVRKKKYTSDEIHDARARQESRLHRYNTEVHNVNLATGKGKAAAAKRLVKAERDHDTNEDRVIAEHMTRGEKAVEALLFGPIALATIPGNRLNVRATAKAVDKARRGA